MNNLVSSAIKMWITCVNTCIKLRVNYVYKNVKNFHSTTTPCKTPTFKHTFKPLLLPLFTNFSSSITINTYPLLHRPYYYNYYMFINNINNRKD